MHQLKPVPHLETAIKGPLQILEATFLEKQILIESWFRKQWQESPAPIYASVDLRNAGFKLAPVDTNLFPAGFNNLSPTLLSLSIQAIQSFMEHNCPNANRIVIIPENHTRNTFYMESVAALANIVRNAGYEIRIGSLQSQTDSSTIDLPSGEQITLEPLTRRDNKLYVGDDLPCLIILNNDLSGGRPAILESLEQPIYPPLELGWSQRLKSEHFAKYRDLAIEFAQLIDIDPWFIDPLMRNCGKIDFMKREGTECLVHNVSELLTSIQKKYNEYGITKKPFVFVKADAGTYGMGVMAIDNVEQLQQLNRKQRTRMDSTKEGQKVQKVIIQEGIYTSETVDENSTAEPVVYMIDHFVVGGFYRVHTQKSESENLNSPGMHFKPLAFAKPCNSPDKNMPLDSGPNRFYAYGVIARLALLAASKEIAEYK